jgi:hypothetical protein
MPNSLTSVSPLVLIVSAMRVKSPFSQRALFGFVAGAAFPPAGDAGRSVAVVTMHLLVG